MIRFKAPDIDIEGAEILARSLTAAVAIRRIYALDHHRARIARESLVGGLQAYLAKPGIGRFYITASDGMLAHEGIPLGTREGPLGQLAVFLEERRCGGVTFREGVMSAALAKVIDWLADRNAQPPPRSLSCIDFHPLGAGDNTEDGDDALAPADVVPEFEMPNQLHHTAQTVMTHVMDDMRMGREIDFTEIVELTQWTSEAAYSHGVQLIAPTQTQRYDNYTLNHSVNVFLIATTLMQSFAEDAKELARFSQAALLHDVGKSRIPGEILHKKDRLTEDEFAVIRRHPEYGAEMLQRCPHTDPLTVEVAYCHHMRDGGLGYPSPTLPIRPGPVSGFVQIADMFEALTAHRPYHQGLPTEAAIRKILDTPGMEGRRPMIALLLRQLTTSPPGAEVTLRSGERGIVVAVHPDQPKRPMVRVIEDADGNEIEEPYALDLREAPADENPIARVCLKPNAARKVENVAHNVAE